MVIKEYFMIKKILKGNKTLVKGTLFSLFSFFNKGTSFVLLILIASYLLPADYGKLSLFNTIVTFLSFFVALSTDGYISISYFKNDHDGFRKDFMSIVEIILFMALLLGLVCIICNRFIIEKLDFSLSLQVIALLISFMTIFVHMLLNYMRVKEQIMNYGLISCGHALLVFLLTLYFIIGNNDGWKGKIFAEVICSVLFCIIAIFVFAKNNLFALSLDKERLKIILLWGLPLIPHLASVWLKQGGDRFIINHFMSLEEVGLFSFALNMNSVIIMIGSAFNATNSVSIFKILSSELSGKEKLVQLHSQTKTIILLYFVAFFAIIVGVSILVPFFMQRYEGSLPFFYILSFQGLGQCFYFLFCNYLFYYHKNRNLMLVTFSTSLLHLLLSYILTRYSLYFTAVVYVITQTIMLYVIYQMSLKLIKTSVLSK